MRPFGAETQKKIERHRQMRSGKGFQTLECYGDLRTLDDSIQRWKKNLYTYQSTTGDIYEKEKIVNYLAREGFKINSDKNYDGIGVDNIVFTCSTTQAFSVILNVIMKEEDVILMTGPNYGLFALEPERLNGRE